jgi:hypothetical protein
MQSPTVWAVLALFLINDVEPIKAVLPGGWLVYVNVLVTMAAMYFRLNPCG